MHQWSVRRVAALILGWDSSLLRQGRPTSKWLAVIGWNALSRKSAPPILASGLRRRRPVGGGGVGGHPHGAQTKNEVGGEDSKDFEKKNN